jgi:hypothetical protein
MKKLFLVLMLAPLLGVAQSITWSWPNMPCAFLLNCDSGCTACNLPVNTDASLYGNNMGRQGIDLCPQAVVPGDNALRSYGWPVFPDDSHSLFITAIAFSPIHIDSVIVRHRSDPDGPQRLEVKYGVNASDDLAVVSDAPIPSSFATTTITDLGYVAAGEGMVYGLFELRFQAYQGAGGSWDIDDVRVVATPWIQSGMEEPSPASSVLRAEQFDMLGRPVGTDVASGVYGRQHRWVALDPVH